jgi:hypothetical protein
MDQNPNFGFEARRLARAPGWYVRIAWPNGRHEHVPGFVTREEALRWIEEKAEAWLSDHAMGPSLFAPAPARARPGWHFAKRAASGR